MRPNSLVFTVHHLFQLFGAIIAMSPVACHICQPDWLTLTSQATTGSNNTAIWVMCGSLHSFGRCRRRRWVRSIMCPHCVRRLFTIHIDGRANRCMTWKLFTKYQSINFLLSIPQKLAFNGWRIKYSPNHHRHHHQQYAHPLCSDVGFRSGVVVMCAGWLAHLPPGPTFPSNSVDGHVWCVCYAHEIERER